MYQVRDWDKHFENAKSRSTERCSFVCVPNKQHGLGLLHLMSLPDGAAVYGIWNLILGACSQHSSPRSGWLTNNGRPDGKPWSTGDLAWRWRRPESEITRALQVLSSQEVDWISVQSIEEVSAKSPPTALEGNGSEGNRSEGKEECCEPDACKFPEFPVAGRPNVWTLKDELVCELTEVFPAVDVPAECRKAHVWVKTNLRRRKTGRGMPEFLRRWMSRQQDSGGSNSGPTGSAAHSRAVEQKQRLEALK